MFLAVAGHFGDSKFQELFTTLSKPGPRSLSTGLNVAQKGTHFPGLLLVTTGRICVWSLGLFRPFQHTGVAALLAGAYGLAQGHQRCCAGCVPGRLALPGFRPLRWRSASQEGAVHAGGRGRSVTNKGTQSAAPSHKRLPLLLRPKGAQSATFSKGV